MKTCIKFISILGCYLAFVISTTDLDIHESLQNDIPLEHPIDDISALPIDVALAANIRIHN